MSYQQPWPEHQPQQPYYQQPPTPEQQRVQQAHQSFVGSRWSWLIVGLLIGFGIGYASHVAPVASTPASTSVIQAATQDTATGGSQPTSAPTSATNRVGSHVTSGVWQITINSAKTITGTEFDTPKAGNIYLLISFTAKDIDTNAQDMSPIFFTLRNEQGDTYDLAYIDVPSNPRGPVVSGQQLRGDLSYEVPKSLHTFVLQFDSPEDANNSQIVQWTITK